MKPQAIIVDLDGTLIDSEHRIVYDINGEIDLDRSCKEEDIKRDQLIKPIGELVWAMKAMGHLTIIYLTARSERYRKVTIDWLNTNMPTTLAHTVLLMRPDDNHDPDYICKSELFSLHIKDKYDVLFAVDDNNDNTRMFNRYGILTLLVSKGANYEKSIS